MSTRATGFKLLRATSPTSAETAPVHISVTKPVNVIPVGGANAIRLRFFGTNDADEAAVAQVWLVDSDATADGIARTWYSTKYAEFAVILGTLRGAAGALVDENQFLADGVAVTEFASTAYDSVFNNALIVYTSTANEWGEVVLQNLAGAEGIVVAFTTLSTAASVNGIFSMCEF